MGDVLVYVQAKAGKVSKAGIEALCSGKRLADSLGAQVQAIAFGAIDGLGDLGKYGVTRIHHVSADAFTKYSQDGYARVIADLTNSSGAAAVLLGGTAQGRDLGPRVAAALDTGYAGDIVELSADGGKITARRPVYGGKAFVSIEIDGVFVTSLRPNAFEISESPADGAVESLDPGLGESDLKAVVAEILAATEGKLDVSEADVVVAGGRGLKAPENWRLVEGLADVLGGACGASRAVVDAGWRPHAEQVGQTGKTVSPKLYIALGISGAIQHLAGMTSSKTIVAINKDPQAPIFKVADYGIVGDVLEVVPALTEKLSAAMQS